MSFASPALPTAHEGGSTASALRTGSIAAEPARASMRTHGIVARPAAFGAARARLLPLRDAVLASLALATAVFAGSGGGAKLDPALYGYLAAVFVAWFATVWRASAFWRRPSSAFYARALAGSLLRPNRLRATLAHAGRDLGAQSFIGRRSRGRWIAHLLLSLGTLASFAITLPLVFGWMLFAADRDGGYRVVLFTLPTVHLAIDGVLAWLLFHGLVLAAIAVALGATTFLVRRVRLRRLPGETSGFAIAPLALLLAVALSGLALPATRDLPALFPVVAAAHEVLVIVLLLAIPFSKLGHLLIRPLQLGARAVRAAEEPRSACSSCGAPFVPSAQHAAITRLLEARGLHLGGHAAHCPACRRRRVATAQAALVDAHFQPRLAGARPAPPRAEKAA